MTFLESARDKLDEPLTPAAPVPDPWEAVVPAERLPPITVDVTRAGRAESRHVVYGVLWSDLDRRAAAGSARVAWGDAALVTFLRSALKPVQALPLLVDGVAERLGLTDAELALACASHSAEPRHLEVLAGLLAKARAHVDDLRCGPHAPYHEPSAHALAGRYDPRHNNCSGKHAGMLTWTNEQGADPATYPEPTHPIQRRIAALTALLSGVPGPELGHGVDGCGVPTYAMTLGHMARLFHLLGQPQRFPATAEAASVPDDEAQRIAHGLTRLRDAMRAHPWLVAGSGRADTDIIGATEGRLVTKSGAEGLWCGVHVERGVAFAFKAIDGNFRAAVPAALAALAQRGILSDADAARLAPLARPNVVNRAGATVGAIVPHLP